jgi:hypothetical protein
MKALANTNEGRNTGGTGTRSEAQQQVLHIVVVCTHLCDPRRNNKQKVSKLAKSAAVVLCG